MFGIHKQVEPQKILAVIGIYVDDCLAVGQVETVQNVSFYLMRLWNTSVSQYLANGNNLLAIFELTIHRSFQGLFLQHVQYTEFLLEEHASLIPARVRTTTGETLLLWLSTRLCHWLCKLCSRISRSSRTDLGISSNTLR